MASDWDIDTSWTYRMEEDVRIEVQLMCDEAATETMVRAKARVPQPGMSKGYSLGSLKESGYTANARTSGYDNAISRAKSVPGTRIVERGQIESPMWIDISDPDTFAAIVHFPLTYADIIRFGYYHVLGRKQIQGNDFLMNALSPVDRGFQARANRVVRYLMAKYSR